MANSGRRRDRRTWEALWAEQRRWVDRALARFSASYMSDAKWRKAFRILAEPELGVVSYRWKFVGDDGILTTGVVGPQDVEQSHLRDGRFQPLVYREVEWLEVLTDRPEEATAALARAGKFPVQPCEGGIRLVGYG